MHNYLTATGKSAFLWRPGPVSEGIHPATAALLCFYFGLPIVWPVFSAPVAVYWIQNKWVQELCVQELRALTEHTGLSQP